MASIRKRGDTYAISVSMGYTSDGKQIRKNTTFKPPDNVTSSKKDKLAREFAVAYEQKVRGYVGLNENARFSELVEWYYSTIAPLKLKPAVLQGDKYLVDTFVLPRLGNEKIKNLTPVLLDGFLLELLQNGRVLQEFVLKEGVTIDDDAVTLSKKSGVSQATILRLKHGNKIKKANAEKLATALDIPFNDLFVSGVADRALSNRTCQRIKVAMSAVFTCAVKKGLLIRSPIPNTMTISIDTQAQSYLDETQAAELLKALDNQDDFQFRVMVNALLFTGMRAGELCGLLWECVDLQENIIFIKYTLSYLRNVPPEHRHTLQAPKTSKSERYVAIPQLLSDLLKAHKRKQEGLIKSLGGNYKGTVFTRVNGDYFSTHYLNNKLKRFAAKIGLPPDFHAHSLRHTAASLLINSDVSAKHVAEQLGHSRTTTTENVYGHIFASSKVKTMQALEMALLKNEKEPPNESG